jgi:predicted Ser/Thr protein kinase
MAATVLKDAKVLEVNRSDLRQNQSKWLKKARGQNVLLIKSNDTEEEKVVLDKQYYDELRRKLESLVETLEIAMDRKLFNQILTAADTLEEDLRLGKLHSLEDAFAEG